MTKRLPIEHRLKPTHRATYDAIVRHIDRHGYPPTIRELMADLRLNSSSQVVYRLNVLEKTGLIRRGVARFRSIVVTDAGRPHGRHQRLVDICAQMLTHAEVNHGLNADEVGNYLGAISDELDHLGDRPPPWN